MGLAMVGTGSRGPLLMLGGTVALTMVAVMLKPGRRMRALLLIAALGVVAVGAILSGLIPVAAVDRFESLWNGANADTSARSRLLVMDVAWRLFMTYPIFGRGVGSVSAFGVGRDLIYPHNILLELGAETGLVGLGLFLSLMSMVLWRLLARLHHEANQEAIWPILFATLLFTLSNAMVSGDLNDGRDMWMLAGIAIASSELRGETG
jgi:O-antigen ligase